MFDLQARALSELDELEQYSIANSLHIRPALDALSARVQELEGALQFYADREHWRTRNSDGTLTNQGYGLAYHRTGDGQMEVLSSNCGHWVASAHFVHGGYWQADAGHIARSALHKDAGA